MAFEWRNNKQPVNGEYIVDLDAEDGSQPQTFKGATIEEVTDKLLNAQLNATRRINELRKDVTPDPKKPRKGFKPRTLTADENFKLANDVRTGDVRTAVATVVEAELGAPLSEVRERLQHADNREMEEIWARETTAFVKATPEWYPTEANKLALYNYMQEKGMEWTVKNFKLAFDRLMESGLLTRKPAEPVLPEPGELERIVPQPTSRPRGAFATGIRSSDVSGSAIPPKAPQRYTRQQLENMPRAEYRAKMETETGFVEAVERAYAGARA